MTNVWRGVIQKSLRSLANRMDGKPLKRWNADGQRLGIAICLAIFVTAGVALGLMIALTAVVTRVPPCSNAECFQYMWQGRWAMWSFVATVGILVATVGSILYIRQSLLAGREIQKQEFRSYLGFEDDNVFFVKGRAKEFKIKLRNFGRTAAFNTKITFDTFINETNTIPEADAFSDIDLDFGGAIIYPDEDAFITLDAPVLSRAQMSAFDCSEIEYFVYARVRYRDIFGQPHLTQSCFTFRQEDVGAGRMASCIFGQIHE